MVPTTIMSFPNTHGVMGEVDIAVIAWGESVIGLGQVELVPSTEECILGQYDRPIIPKRKTYISACYRRHG